MTAHLVFVYGSLKKGFHNHPHFLAGAVDLGDARTESSYLMMNGGAFPYLIDPATLGADHEDSLADVIGTVKGEAYAIGEVTLAALDHLESHPDFYRRKQVNVTMGTGADKRTFPAWVYFLHSNVIDVLQHTRAIMPDEAGNVEWAKAREEAFEVSQGFHDDESEG